MKSSASRIIGFRDFINDNNLIGIIPAISNRMSLGFEWPDYLMPIATKFTLIENAVQQQAIMGVDSIWIVTDRSMISLLKNTVGENIFDPISIIYRGRKVRKTVDILKARGYKREFHKFGKAFYTEDTKPIPIYMVSLPPQDRYNGYEQSDIWGVIYAAYIAKNLFERFTSFGVPERFLITSPYGIIPASYYLKEENLQKLRVLRDRLGRGYSRKIVSKDGVEKRYDANPYVYNVLFTNNGRDATTGNLLPFTIDKKIWDKMRKFVYNQSKVCYKEVEGQKQILTLSDFMPTIADSYEKCHRYETESYYELNNFDDYSEYIAYRSQFAKEPNRGHGHIDFLSGFYGKDYRPGRINWGKDYIDLESSLYESMMNKWHLG